MDEVGSVGLMDAESAENSASALHPPSGSAPPSPSDAGNKNHKPPLALTGKAILGRT